MPSKQLEPFITKQQLKSITTKNQLKKSALDLFIQKGFDNTSLLDITSNANYATGTFYRHFKSKDDVLIELWKDHTNEYINDSICGVENYKTFEESILYLLDRSEEFGVHPIFKCYYNSKVSLSPNSPPDIAYEFNQLLKNIISKRYINYNQSHINLVSYILHTLLNHYALQNSNIDIQPPNDKKLLYDMIIHMTKAYE